MTAVVHDRDRDQVVVAHQHRDVHHVGVRADPHRIGIADVAEQRTRIGLNQRDQPGHPAQPPLLADRVHAGERFRLQVHGLADRGEHLVHRGAGGQREVVHAHQAAGAGGVEAHQGQHLGALAGREQVEDRLAAPLRELGDRVGRVVGAHPAEHLGDLLVGPRAEQPGGPFVVKFLEDVSLQFRVGMHPAEDLGFLVLGRLLEQVSDLGRSQQPDPRERAAQHRAPGVTDQRLELPLVLENLPVRLLRPAQAEPREQPAGAAPGGHPGQHPFTVAGRAAGQPPGPGGRARTSISRCPSTSARSSTSPSRRSNLRRSSRALVSLSSSPSKELTCSMGT